jgi:hypothetical protein
MVDDICTKLVSLGSRLGKTSELRRSELRIEAGTFHPNFNKSRGKRCYSFRKLKIKTK